MFENIMKFFKKFNKKQESVPSNSKETAKERLHLVLMQDRANVSADFLELMKQEIIEVIKKYIDVDEKAIDVRLTNKENEDGTNGAPALYANIPILNIKNEARKIEKEKQDEKQQKEKSEEKQKIEYKKIEKQEQENNKTEQKNDNSREREDNKNKENQEVKQKHENKENQEIKQKHESKENKKQEDKNISEEKENLKTKQNKQE